MIRSTLSVSAGLAAIAVVLATLWIWYGPRPQPGQDKRPAAAIPLSQQQRSASDAKGQAIRTITPGQTTGTGLAATAPTGLPPSAAPSTGSSGKSAPAADPATAQQPADGAINPSLRGETRAAAGEPSATNGGNVDLNTASVEQLNALGAGMIGKRIIEFRPYTTPDELVTRRVLKRADYDAIRAAVTVR